MNYQIRITGHLDPQWSDWFEGLEVIQVENGDTLLLGPIRDQVALHGILSKIRNLNLPLVEVRQFP